MSVPGGGRPPTFPQPPPGAPGQMMQPTFGGSPSSPHMMPFPPRTQSAPAYGPGMNVWQPMMAPHAYPAPMFFPQHFGPPPGAPHMQGPPMKPTPVTVAAPSTPKRIVITDKSGQPVDLTGGSHTPSAPSPAAAAAAAASPAAAPATPVAADKGAAAPSPASASRVVIATPDGKPLSREELATAAKAPAAAAKAEEPKAEPAKPAEEPAKKAEEPAKKAEEPAKKAEEPAKKAEEPEAEPAKPAVEPAKPAEEPKAEEPAKKAEAEEEDKPVASPQIAGRADSVEGTEGEDAGDDESDGMRTPASMSRTASSQGVVIRDGIKRISRDELLRYRGVTDVPKDFDSFPGELKLGADVRHTMSFVPPSAPPVGGRTRSKGAGGDRDRAGRKGGKGDGDRGDRDRGGRRGNRGQPLPTNVAPLTVSENAYRIVKPTDLNQVEATLRHIRAILNKLTLDNFEPLSKELLAIDITDPAELKNMVDLFFEKAVDEPRFGPVYANMCYVIRNDKREVIVLTEAGEPEKKTLGDTFRQALLKKCQAAFEQKEFRAAELTPEERAALTPEQIEEMDFQRHRAKRQMLGIMTFIGELYKFRMLREQIMHDCIRRLSDPEADEQDLECLCNLLRTVGQQLDSAEGGKKLMDEHFKRLQEWATKGSLPARIRFMIEGIIDLRRKDRWISKKDTKLKTIDQIHQEAEEQLRAASRTSSRQSTDRRSMGGSRAPPPLQDRVQLDRLGMKAQSTSSTATTLAPSWQKRTASSGGSSQTPPMPAAQAPPKAANKFDALAVEELSSSPPSATPPSRGKHEPSPVATSKPTGNPDHVRTKSAALVEEYLGIRDMEEAERCVRELEDQNLNGLIVSTLITSTLEKKAAQIDLAIKLLAALLANGALTAADFVAGFDEAFAEIDDLTTDIPSCPSIAAEYIAQAVVRGKVPPSALGKLSTVRQAETFGKIRDMAVTKVLAAAGDSENAAALSAEVKEALSGTGAPSNLAEATIALQSRLEAAVADPATFSDKLSTFDAAESLTPRFAKQLMFVLLSHLHPEGEPVETLRKSELEAYTDALKQYADHNVEVITGLLEGVDRFVVERSPSDTFAHALMRLLYDTDVAPEEAINDWRKNAAPSAQMLAKVGTFLNWLDTAPSESD